MKKCYISGRIKNNPHYLDQFSIGESAVRKLGFEPVNPCSLPHDHDKTIASFIREDILALLDCNAIFMLGGWENSVGAKLEHEIARQIGLIIFYEFSYNEEQMLTISVKSTEDIVLDATLFVKKALLIFLKDNEQRREVVNFVMDTWFSE